jgi:ABC-type antimicrobial peptide transport system permease subunit
VVQERLVARLSAFFGILAVTLAAIGLYGVMSYGVARRTNEIGLRMALGAKGSNVIGMILREVMLLTVAGAVAGVAVAMACTRFVQSQLFGLTPNDPLTFAVAGVILLVVGTVAGYIPAKRASKIDPMVALRYE